MRSAASSMIDTPVPESVLPEQFFDHVKLHTIETPERRLMFAVLLDALVQLRRPNSTAAAEVQRWIRREDEWPCSFRNVCEALGIEASYLARGLRAWCTNPRSALLGLAARKLRASRRSKRRIGLRTRSRRYSTPAVHACARPAFGRARASESAGGPGTGDRLASPRLR
jgi:hypothetical protein